MHLPDPRVYPRSQVKNSVVLQLNSVLAETDPQRRQEKQASLEFLLGQYLTQDQQEALVVALSLVPSQAAYQHLWQTIKSLILPPTAQQAQIFALPIILVAGTSRPLSLPAKLSQTELIVQQLKNSKVIDVQADIFLGTQLYSGETLASISLPQLYRWQSALQYTSGGLPLPLTTEPLKLTKQAVILRYLLGIAMRTPKIPAPINWTKNVATWGLPVAEWIQQDLHHEGLTLFTIPRQPQPLLEALETGQYVYYDVALQVFVSDTIKKYRSQRKTPTASIACHHNNEIKLVISSVETPKIWEGFVWPLQALDHPTTLGQHMEQLLQECQVEHIILLPDIQAASLFITPQQAGDDKLSTH